MNVYRDSKCIGILLLNFRKTLKLLDEAMEDHPEIADALHYSTDRPSVCMEALRFRERNRAKKKRPFRCERPVKRDVQTD